MATSDWIRRELEAIREHTKSHGADCNCEYIQKVQERLDSWDDIADRDQKLADVKLWNIATSFRAGEYTGSVAAREEGKKAAKTGRPNPFPPGSPAWIEFDNGRRWR